MIRIVMMLQIVVNRIDQSTRACFGWKDYPPLATSIFYDVTDLLYPCSSIVLLILELIFSSCDSDREYGVVDLTKFNNCV